MKTYLTETDDLYVVTTRGGFEVFATYDESEDETRFQLTTVLDSVSNLDADGSEETEQLRIALEQQYGVDNVDDCVIAGGAIRGNVLTEEEFQQQLDLYIAHSCEQFRQKLNDASGDEEALLDLLDEI